MTETLWHIGLICGGFGIGVYLAMWIERPRKVKASPSAYVAEDRNP